VYSYSVPLPDGMWRLMFSLVGPGVLVDVVVNGEGAANLDFALALQAIGAVLLLVSLQAGISIHFLGRCRRQADPSVLHPKVVGPS